MIVFIQMDYVFFLYFFFYNFSYRRFAKPLKYLNFKSQSTYNTHFVGYSCFYLDF